MKTTAAKFVSALFASVVASSTLTAAPETGEKEKEKPADTCLLGPSASVPSGGHWYYRVDRVNKRNCWYLGETKDKGARKPTAPAEEDSAATEKPVAPSPKKPATQRSATDARAELPLPQPSVQPDTRVVAPQRFTAAPADAQGAGDASTAVTTRWPEPAAVSQPAPPPPAPAAARVAEAPPQAQAQPQATPAAPPPRSAAGPPSPAKANAAAGAPLSMPMLLTVLVGGLSVVGVMGSAMFARGKSRRDKSRPRRRLSRSAPMPPLPTAEEPLPAKAPPPENPRAPDDPNRRLQQMLAEIQRRAAA